VKVEYTDLSGITSRDFSNMKREFDQAGASVVTLVLLPTGELHVLSPMDTAWTRHFLLEAGIGMRVGVN